MAIAQRPLVTRRDMLKIFGEDRLVAVIRTATPELAERAARAVAEGGVRLVEITLTVPDATELIAKLASDNAFRDSGDKLFVLDKSEEVRLPSFSFHEGA